MIGVLLTNVQAKAIVDRMNAGDEEDKGFASVELENMSLGFVAATFTKSEWRHGDRTREYAYKLDGTELTR